MPSDYGTRITTAFDSSQQTIREIHVKDGTLQLRNAERQTRNYTIRNVDAKAKTLILQQEGISQYSVLSPKPAERTATAYRFEVNVPANGSQTLKVEQERTTENLIEILSSTPDFLAVIVENKELSERGKKQLQGILDLEAPPGCGRRQPECCKSPDHRTDRRSARLRQNIDSLNRVKGQEEQVRQYSTQLAANEAQLAKYATSGAIWRSAHRASIPSCAPRLTFWISNSKRFHRNRKHDRVHTPGVGIASRRDRALRAEKLR